MNCPRCGNAMKKGQYGNRWFNVCLYCDFYRQIDPHAQEDTTPPSDDGGVVHFSPLEATFLQAWGSERKQPRTQYTGAVPGRRFRVDFAWPAEKVVVECEGYDHRMEAGFYRDIEKYNLLTLHGWRVLRCTTRLLRDDPQGFCRLVETVLEGEEV